MMLNSFDHEKEIDQYMKDNNIEVMHKERWWNTDGNVIKHVTIFYSDTPVWKPLIDDADGSYVEITDDIHYYVLIANYDTDEEYESAKKRFAEQNG